MNVFAIDKGIGGLSAYRKSIVACVVVAVIMSIFVGCGKDRVKVSGAEIEALSKQIKDLVTGLEYSDKVAEDFCQMVLGWKDTQGQPVLVVWKKKVHEAKEDYKQGKMSKIRLAKVEESIARKVSQRIRKEISRKEKVFDLADAIKHKQANCLGCSQLFYLLGNCVGLAVQVIHVEELKAGHMASIVGLPDATTMMVDLTFGRIMSKPFKFEKEFSKVGHYWELKNKNNPLGIHRRIQRWNKNELIAAIYNSRRVHYKMLREYHKAIYAYNKAIELNPKYAE
ncbi:tetratricopeptide repeat protein, partial [bacterium]|nr:tetratricopeptide repeat protein [bacterium]